MDPPYQSPHSPTVATCPYQYSQRFPIRILEDQFQYFLPAPHTPPSPKCCLTHSITSPIPRIYLCSPRTCYVPRPSYSPPFYHLNDTRWTVPATQLLPTQFSPVPCYSLPITPSTPSHPLQHPNLPPPPFQLSPAQHISHGALITKYTSTYNLWIKRWVCGYFGDSFTNQITKPYRQHAVKTLKEKAPLFPALVTWNQWKHTHFRSDWAPATACGAAL